MNWIKKTLNFGEKIKKLLKVRPSKEGTEKSQLLSGSQETIPVVVAVPVPVPGDVEHTAPTPPPESSGGFKNSFFEWVTTAFNNWSSDIKGTAKYFIILWLLGAGLFVTYVAFRIFYWLVFFAAANDQSDAGQGVAIAANLFSAVAYGVIVFFGYVFYEWFYLYLYRIMLRKVRGEEMPRSIFPPCLCCEFIKLIIVRLIISAVCVMCFWFWPLYWYVAVTWSMVTFIMLDPAQENCGPIEALYESARLVRGYRIELFIVLFVATYVSSAVALLGVLTLGIVSVIALSLSLYVTAYLYAKLVEMKGTRRNPRAIVFSDGIEAPWWR